MSLSRGRNEIYLSDLTLPRRVDSAEGFEIKGKIESLRDAPARVKLLRDGFLAREQELQLKAGANQVNFRESLKERGSHTYELLVEARDDTLAENNLLQGVVEVQGPPRVLLLSAQKEGQRFLSRVLQVQGYAVVESAPEANPLTLPELSSFDLVVLDNVPAFQLSLRKDGKHRKVCPGSGRRPARHRRLPELWRGRLLPDAAGTYPPRGHATAGAARPAACGAAIRSRQIRQHGRGAGRKHQTGLGQGGGHRGGGRHESHRSGGDSELRRGMGLDIAFSPGR